MLKYLVILLDNTSVAYCNYNGGRSPKLIGLDDLQRAITFGMKENLQIQFVYPDSILPAEYDSLIDSIDHISIKPAHIAKSEDIAVCSIADILDYTNYSNVVLRASLHELQSNIDKVTRLVGNLARVNIVITDVIELSDSDLNTYSEILDHLVDNIILNCKNGGKLPQLNVLTDRLILTAMNNCNAGYETITVAPDGKFYICPAFYYGNKYDCGSLAKGLIIKNPQLFKIDNAPICRKCDAWHCHRCVWLNQAITLEVNTPGHIQCKMSHIERNASRKLLHGLREIGEFMPDTDIHELSYLDPFDNIIQ